MSGYEQVKALSAAQGTPIPDLLALARNNDPFFAGAPAQIEKAAWFSNLWDKFGYQTGVHLRRVHYQIVSTGALLPNGKNYENTIECWSFLCDAGKAARYLGMVPATAFEDRRNPPATQYVSPPVYGQEPRTETYVPDWELPEVKAEFNVSLDEPAPYVDGYSYELGNQPYYLALFVEKSTMNDVLAPVCQELGIDYYTSLGFQSITTTVSLLQKIESMGKPARIFYISDFDPAGDGMPTAVARQIEFWRSEQDVALQPIALTAAQVRTFGLPPIPVKESDLRSPAFLARYGVAGATELDALEALHPGSLGQIVRDAAAPYRDMNYPRRLYRVRVQAESIAADQWREHTADLTGERTDIEDQVQTIVDTYRSRLQDLADEMAAELAPLRERVTELRTSYTERIETFRPELPERPEPIADGDDGDLLFDSSRDYMTQLDYYKARKAGN